MVFGIFKKKPDNKQVAVETICTVLHLQLGMGDGTFQKVIDDNWASGYLYGFADGIMQRLSVNNQAETLALMTICFKQLFEDQIMGVALARKCIQLQQDQNYMEGVFAGGREAFAYIDAQTAPMGLARRLLGM